MDDSDDRYATRPVRHRSPLDILGPIGRQKAGEAIGQAKPLISSKRSVGLSQTLAADDGLVTFIDQIGDDELGAVVTVSFMVERPDSFASGDVLRVRAEIKWGSGGRQQAAVIDVRNGTMVSVPASFLRVSLANEGTQITPVVGAQVAYLPRGGSGNAVRTRYRDTNLASGSTADFAVPAFARLVTVFRTPENAAMTLRFLDSNNVLDYEVRVSASTDSFRIPLANDVQTVRVLADGTAIPRLRLVFDLDL